MLDHRLQILIDDERHQRLLAVARERGVSVATIVREAIDRKVGEVRDSEKQSAWEHLLAAEPVDFGTPEELKAELDEIRGSRFSDLL